jgi:hypothetical protein
MFRGKGDCRSLKMLQIKKKQVSTLIEYISTWGKIFITNKAKIVGHKTRQFIRCYPAGGSEDRARYFKINNRGCGKVFDRWRARGFSLRLIV